MPGQTFGQIFGQPLSPSCGPARHWARCCSQSFGQPPRGKETRRTGWGRKDGPGHEPCARAGTGRRQLGTWFQGRLKAASRTGNQKRQIRTGGQGRQSGKAVRGNDPGQMAGNGRSKPMVRGVRKEVCLTVLSTSGPRLFAGALVSFRLQGSLSVLVACLSEEPVCRLPRFLRFLSALYQFFRQFFSFPGP